MIHVTSLAHINLAQSQDAKYRHRLAKAQVEGGKLGISVDRAHAVRHTLTNLVHVEWVQAE
jgi:hypothetical protein